MASIKPVGGKIQVEVEKFDGGLNTTFSPNKVDIYESPDCLNVVFPQDGSVQTRFGCDYFNTSTTETGAFKIDGGISYNGSMIVWAGGSMYRASGTTFVTVPSAQSQFTPGAKVAAVIYQDYLFCSDGTNGPYRYQSGSDFYRMGIAVPSAPTAASNVPTATGAGPEGGTYYYKVSYVNTGVVEGMVGSMSAGLTIASTAVVNVNSIPIGVTSLGVDSRFIYRASTTTGTFRYVGTLANNTASVFTDTVGATTWAAGAAAPTDATAPTPFTTIALHKERLFFDDSADRTILRYTEYTTPFVSKVADFIPLLKGDQSNITAIAVQQDLVTAFKLNSHWFVSLVDPSDDTSWLWEKSPSLLGIVGPRAFTTVENGIIFLGRRNEKITGFHYLSGVTLFESNNQDFKTDTISKRIENGILAMPRSYWGDAALFSYGNRVFAAVTKGASDTSNKNIYWFDLSQIAGTEYGSWALWDGRASQVSCLFTHNGTLYAGSSQADGYILEMEIADQYNDAGLAIDSYFWTKPIGGEESISSWIKDFRFVNVWYYLLGAWMMRVNYRVDQDISDGGYFDVNLDPNASLWGTMMFGVDTWGGGPSDLDTQHPLGPLRGRRLQVRFSNNNTADAGFKVHSMKILFNARRQR